MATPGAEEKFALSRIFASESDFDVAVRAGLSELEVLERKETGAGFISRVWFASPLPSIVNVTKWEWYFRHTSLAHGGAFLCWFDSAHCLFVNAISYGGDWPSDFRPEAFTAIA